MAITGLYLASTAGGKSVRITYNDYGPSSGSLYATFLKSSLVQLDMDDDQSRITMSFSNDTDLNTAMVSYDDGVTDYTQPVDGYILTVISKVEGTTPTDQSNLYDLLESYMS